VIQSASMWRPNIHVEGDRSRLQQVIVNLVANGIKYTQEGGDGRSECSAQTVVRLVRSMVSDNGVGISAPRPLPHVFERFTYRGGYKARSSVTPAGQDWVSAIVKAICTAAWR